MTVTPLELENDFGVTRERGFLPESPLSMLSAHFDPLERALKQLPGLLAAGKWGPTLETIPFLNIKKLQEHEYERFHMLLAYAVSAYVWEHWQKGVARDHIPAHIAVPFVQVSRLIGREPILSYVGYAQNNYYLLDPDGPIELGNIALMQHFLGGLDEEWFTVVHIEIEAHAGRAIYAAVRAQEAAMCGDSDQCRHELEAFAHAFSKMNAAFARMPEKCDPYIYFERVRIFIQGWFNQKALPNGVWYDGVEEYAGKPQKYRGETGAQSSFMPLFDAIFGVKHEPSVLSEHLTQVRRYMPVKHRALIETIEARPDIHSFVLEHPSLITAFNQCIDEVLKFRDVHRDYADKYIRYQSGSPGAHIQSTEIGTGGTSIFDSLAKHWQETADAKIPF